MSTNEDTEKRRRIMDKISAIWSVEGHEFTTEFKELQEQFVSGEISLEDFKREILPKPGFNV